MFKSLLNIEIALVTAPTPDWTQPFGLMCDASDYAMGDTLVQRGDKVFHLIAYTSKTLNEVQENYTTIEKELLAIVFTVEKFMAYLLG